MINGRHYVVSGRVQGVGFRFFVRDAAARQITLPGSTVLSVAVGFEIWSGPIAKLTTDDFYVQVQ